MQEDNLGTDRLKWSFLLHQCQHTLQQFSNFPTQGNQWKLTLVFYKIELEGEGRELNSF